jgi:hypothetical protein
MKRSRTLYAFAVFSSALLLFLIEPIAAKHLLPLLGGSSAVWLTCLVFFQLMLLLGYLYAHWLTNYLPITAQKTIHISLLAVAVALLVAQTRIHAGLEAAASHPVTSIFVVLICTIGLPFLLLASTSPLLQVWLSWKETGSVDYRLFALSNAGSLLALLSYPTLIEPRFTLHLQRVAWFLGFSLYAVLGMVIARYTFRPQATAKLLPNAIASGADPASRRQRWLWFLSPMVAAMQLSAVTEHLTQNIAAIPLLWVLPLTAYLLTFIVAFELPFLYRRGIVARFLVVMLAALGYMLTKTDMSLPIATSISFFLFELFVACYFCHAEVYALRPQSALEATQFYLLIAAGGVAGTFFIGIASPFLFAANYDMAISFWATTALALLITWPDGWAQRLLWSTATLLLFGLVLMLHTVYSRGSLIETRSFYGSLRVDQTHLPPQALTVRTLLNGAIRHGTQWLAPEFQRRATTYYAEDSGIGVALRYCCEGRTRNIGVIGLGVGTLAAYGRVGDQFRFYEINPQVRPIAQQLFTYLRDSPARISFVEGDARVSLSKETPQQFDVLAIDAFSGDAIPLHLLTSEALALYERHLAPNGILAFHVSSQYLNLAPQIERLASSAGIQAKIINSPPDSARGVFAAAWVLVSRDGAFLADPRVSASAKSITDRPELSVWTDDYSSLLPLLRWSGH